MTVAGDGPLADRLRAVGSLSHDDGLAVLVPPLSALPGPFVDVGDDEFAAMWEVPMRWTIAALQASFRAGATRIVLVVPVVAITGGRHHAGTAAAAEGIRATAKSSARQWGAAGVTVNTVVVAGEWFGVDAQEAGPAALVGPAMAGGVDAVAAIAAFATGAAAHVTGQTVVADGGVVMP